jgi:hypothetical protein
LAGSNCRKAIQRMSTTRYFACGYWPQVQFLRIDNWGHLLAQPFGIENKQITDAVVTNFQLKGQQTFNSTLNLPLQMEEFTSLSYIFPADVSQSRWTCRSLNSFIHCSFELFHSRMPDREETSNKVVALLRKVADQLMSSTDATDDVVEPLTNVRQILPDFPLEDLRHLWSIIKNRNSIVWYRSSLILKDPKCQVLNSGICSLIVS